MTQTLRGEVIAEIKNVVDSLIRDSGLKIEDIPSVHVGPPPETIQADLSTNIAFLLARVLHKPSLEIGQQVVKSLNKKDDSLIEKAVCTPPGFINVSVAPGRIWRILTQIMEEDEAYGRCNIGNERKVLIDFVSANPTGPLHIGHGRGAVLGDVIANVLEYCGFKPQREYYINDVGRQMGILGESLKVRCAQLLKIETSFLTEGYVGEYLIEIAKKVIGEVGEGCLGWSIKEFSQYARSELIKQIEDTTEAFGLKFDSWVSEEMLYETERIKKVIELLDESGYTYIMDEAKWLKTSYFGDEKDRVLIRKDGIPTYFAGDLAYHLYKYERGYEILIDIWGADHHGYVDRIKAGIIGCLKHIEDSLVILLYQLVNLYREGQPVTMSTRKGEFITLNEVLSEVGRDACRFFFISRKEDSHIDFDLELAKKHVESNPLYYVQYAHARACSILSKAKEKGINLPIPSEVNLKTLKLPQEHTLGIKLAALSDELINVSFSYDPYRLTFYLIEVATIFHNYYKHHRVIGVSKELSEGRLILVNSVRIVLRNTLKLLGIDAPEKM